MIDEPTMGADQGNGRALGAETLTGYMVQGMLRAPYKVWHARVTPRLPARALRTHALYKAGHARVTRAMPPPPSVPTPLRVSSAQTIWSSATLPTASMLPTLIDSFCERCVIYVAHSTLSHGLSIRL